MIADYCFYAEKYRGGLPQADYAAASLKAEAYLRQITMGRCNRPDLSEKVRLSLQLAACALADHMKQVEESGYASGVASMNNDGISVSYRARSEADVNREQYAIAANYLTWTGLLYRGMGGGCACEA